MKNQSFLIYLIVASTIFTACSNKLISLSSGNLEFVNREISSSDKGDVKTLALNNKNGDGLAIINTVSFDVGTIELELKGENTPGRSFVGIAFNIENDSTYEAIYFRPFNFQTDEPISRDHSVQYISHPKHTWRYLRTNHKGKYKADYPRKPSPEGWFGVSVTVEDDQVIVYDKNTNTELLSVERIAQHKSDKIGLWMGNNSKGEFRNLRILD